MTQVKVKSSHPNNVMAVAKTQNTEYHTQTRRKTFRMSLMNVTKKTQQPETVSCAGGGDRTGAAWAERGVSKNNSHRDPNEEMKS